MCLCVAGRGGGGSNVPKSRKIEGGGGSAPYIQFLKKCNLGGGGVVGSIHVHYFVMVNLFRSESGMFGIYLCKWKKSTISVSTTGVKCPPPGSNTSSFYPATEC